jgi:ABC-type transport system involved in multi-copper enzyme maturation permease subunit
MTEFVPTLRPAGFGTLVRAELFGLRRRTGVLAMTLVWAVQVIAFAYVVPFVVYRSTAAPQALGSLLPSSTGDYIVGTLPIYGGPAMLCIGAITACGDYRFGTLRTLLSRYPGRVPFTLARFAAMTLVLLAVSVMTLALSLGCSGVIAGIQGRPLDYPGAGTLILALGAIWLVSTAWAAFAFLIGILVRNLTTAIVIGLVWTLLVETVLFGGLGAVVPAIGAVRVILLSPSSGSLAAALGSNGTPGVVSTASGPVAALVLFGYVVLSALISVAAFRRRDIN